MLPCLILSIIRYASRVKWSNPVKGVAPSPTHCCSRYQKGSLCLPSTSIANFIYFLALLFNIILVTPWNNFISALVDGPRCSLSDNESPLVSRTLLSILGDLHNAVVWIVSFGVSFSSLFSSLFSKRVNNNNNNNNNLTIQTNGIGKTHQHSWKMRRTNSAKILR